jgi:hypothetical protein
MIPAFLLAAMLVAGCGGDGDGGEEEGDPGFDYPVDISQIDVKSCPAELYDGDWEVLIEGEEAIAYCGKATGTVTTEGQKPVKIENGHCDLSPEHVAMKGGFIGQEIGAEPTEVELNLPQLVINLGRSGGLGTPVTKDGTYVQSAKPTKEQQEEIEITVGGSGEIALVEAFQHEITVILSNDRTRAEFTAKSIDPNDANWPDVSRDLPNPRVSPG